MARKPKHGQGKTGKPISLRIIGGHFRGRKLKCSGDPSVRPMKDRVREALFNLLGPAVKDTHAIDFFGGTGALGMEALSRGAASAQIIEFHQPTARVIEENVATLDVQDRVSVIRKSCFEWWQSNPTLPDSRWLVFVSPPYRFFQEKHEQMLSLVQTVIDRAPYGSLIAVEATADFDFSSLPLPEEWDVRRYPPAVVGVLVTP